MERIIIDNSHLDEALKNYQQLEVVKSLFFNKKEVQESLYKYRKLIPIKSYRDIINIYSIASIHRFNAKDKYEIYEEFLNDIVFNVKNPDERCKVLNDIIKESYAYPIFAEDIEKVFSSLFNLSTSVQNYISKSFLKRHIERKDIYLSDIEQLLYEIGLPYSEISKVLRTLRKTRVLGGYLKYWDIIVKADLLLNFYIVKGCKSAKSVVKDKFGIFNIREEVAFFRKSGFNDRNMNLKDLLKLRSEAKSNIPFLDKIIFYCFDEEENYQENVNNVFDGLEEFWDSFFTYAISVYRYEGNSNRVNLFAFLRYNLEYFANNLKN